MISEAVVTVAAVFIAVRLCAEESFKDLEIEVMSGV